MYKVGTDGKGKCIISYEYQHEHEGRHYTLHRSIALIFKTDGVNGHLDWARTAQVICDKLNEAEQAGQVDGKVHTAKEAALFGQAAG